MRSKTALEVQQAITLRATGCSLAHIAERTGISASTLYRHFKAHSVTKGGLSQEAIDKAKDQLLNDAGFLDAIKYQVAAQIADDLALSKQIREQTLLALEELQAESPGIKSRSLAAIATVCKVTSDIQRRALRMDAGALNEVEELPQLVVSCMTSEDIERAQCRFDDDSELMGD